MPKVGIVMGSDSDLKVMSNAAAMLEKLGIDYEMTIISAHREPDVFFRMDKIGEGKGFKGNHCRSRNGSTSAGNVRSTLSHAGYRRSHVRQESGWHGCTVSPSCRCRPESRLQQLPSTGQ